MEEKYNLRLDNFEGPIDLLYHLIEKNKMSIYDISIAEIADQYMEYIHSMEKMNLDITGDFLVMASNLLYIKSKILLPVPKEEEEEDPKEELIAMLVEYKKIKEVTELMKNNGEEYSKIHYKLPEKIEVKKELKITEQYSPDMLPSIFMKISQINLNKINHNASDVNRLLERDKVTVKSKIREILKGLTKSKNIIFNKLFSPKEKSKIEIVSAFLAMLELNRASRVKIEQDYIFGDIKITRK